MVYDGTENMLARMVQDFGSAITVAQLAKILQCSRGQVYKLIDEKRLPALKVGTMIRLDPGTVAAWIRRRMTIV
jgi:excisionase family DNA binding protein